MKNLAIKLLSLLIVFSFVFTSCKHHDEKKEHEHKKEQKHKHAVHNEQEYQAVKAAISDYVEGLYQVDTTRIIKSVAPSLRKIGYWYNEKEKKYRDNLPMSYRQLVNLSARWNKDGKSVTKDSPKEIKIFEVSSKTATAKLTAEWGIDYFHLGKYNGEWKILNVIWQSMPETVE